MKAASISGQLLIAAPGLEDPNFKHTVVLVCEHSREGAFGLIVNRVLMNSFKPLMNAFDLERSLVDLPIYYGGPVRPDQGYVLYSPCDGRYGSVRITESLAMTASKDILHAIAEKKGPEKFILALGFAGWNASQLDDELMTDSWLVAPLDYDLIFRVPVNDRWRYAAGTIGVDFDRYFQAGGSS
jgi:putative transcriptional regulator